MYIFHCLGSRACNAQQMDWLTVRQTFWSHAARQTVLRPRVGCHQLRIVLKKRCNIYIYIHTHCCKLLAFWYVFAFDTIWWYLDVFAGDPFKYNQYESVWINLTHVCTYGTTQNPMRTSDVRRKPKDAAYAALRRGQREGIAAETMTVAGKDLFQFGCL